MILGSVKLGAHHKYVPPLGLVQPGFPSQADHINNYARMYRYKTQASRKWFTR